MPDHDYFSADYQSARRRFCKRVGQKGGILFSLPIAAKGPQETDLSIDIGWFGGDSSRHVLLHTSGIHGVEAFAGSAIQLKLIDRLPTLDDGPTVVFVHVLNPYGMAWLRRFNENNVDLNRNFLAPEETYDGHPDGYELLYDFLNPSVLPTIDLFAIQAGWLLLRHGRAALEVAVVAGQYDYPKGLFFGGAQMQEGIRLYTEFLSERLHSVERIFTIDVHTGLGSFGEDTLLVAAQHYERIHAVLGSRVQALSAAADSRTYEIRGGHHEGVERLFRDLDVRVDFVGQEFGTYSQLRVLNALRKENYFYNYGKPRVDHPSKRDLRAVFCPPDAGWRREVLLRGQELFDRSLEILLEK